MTRTSAETKNAALTSGSTDRSDQMCISHVGKDCVCSRREMAWSTSLVRFHGGQEGDAGTVVDATVADPLADAAVPPNTVTSPLPSPLLSTPTQSRGE